MAVLIRAAASCSAAATLPRPRSLLERPAPAGGRLLPQLDALRGVAILAVFVQHLGDRFEPLWGEGARGLGAAGAWLMSALHHAWWGVDLFFVVSGFSLSLGYLRAFAAGRAPLRARDFLLRRAARILPGYAVALAVVLAWRREVFALPDIGAALAAHAALLQGYVSPGGIVLIGASWSLTTEAHFYLLTPLLARPLLGRRRGLLLGLGIAALAWGARAALHAAFVEPGVGGPLFELTQRRLIVSRLDQFVLGMLAARVYLDLARSGRAARLAPAGVLAAGVLLIVAFRLEGTYYLDPGGVWAYALMSLATAALVLAACLAPAWIAPSPLRWLGVVSYGVFLYHQLLLGLAAHLAPGAPTWGRMAWTGGAALAASALVGAASWALVERPALRWAERVTRAAGRRSPLPGPA